MNNLSHTQEYYLCAVSPKGGAPTETVTVCLIISGVAELLRAGFLTRDEKKRLSIDNSKPWDNALPYLTPLYEKFIAAKKPQTIKDFIEKYKYSLDAYMSAIIDSLSAVGAIGEYEQKGFFTKKVKRIIQVPKQEATATVVEILRNEFLRNGELTDDTVILAALLDKSGLLGSYFNKTETDALKARMKEVRSSETYAAINKVLTDIDDDTAAIFTAVILPIITNN